MDESEEALRLASIPLPGHGHPDPAAELEAAAAWCRQHGVRPDVYGKGELIEGFEARVAQLLGFEAARFMPSGTMAQQIAMRVWCERSGRRHFGMHPTSHLELHEHRGYGKLHGLDATLVGPRHAPLLAEHLQAVNEPLGALLVELPIREAGGKLPSWEELEALKAAAAARPLPLHLDGARLWECAPAYGRPLDEITRGFSSCYVSFYKGIGAFSGCMLLGPRDFLAQAMVWQGRHGGNLFTLLPNVVTASMGLEKRLARMPLYLARARELADALRDLPGLRVIPDPPHVNMFHLQLELAPADAMRARNRVAREHGLWLFNGARESEIDGACKLELYVGESALLLEPARVRAAFAAMF
jgi:threonine aldolase